MAGQAFFIPFRTPKESDTKHFNYARTISQVFAGVFAYTSISESVSLLVFFRTSQRKCQNIFLFLVDFH